MSDLASFARQHNERFARQRGWVREVVEATEDTSAEVTAAPVLKRDTPAKSVLNAPKPKRFCDELPPDSERYVLVSVYGRGYWSVQSRDEAKTWVEEYAYYKPVYDGSWWLPQPPLPENI